MKTYLTIDDSPTSETDTLTDFLVERGIPAVLFCIGSSYMDLHVPGVGMDTHPQPIINAIQKGFVIGNHTWTHRRSSEIGYDTVVREIEQTERVIDSLYKQAGKTRPVKLLRFPHIDRGCGGWIVDYDATGEYGPTLMEVFGKGLNIRLDRPSAAQMEMKGRIQDYLKREGFTTDVFRGVTYPWYAGTEMEASRDCLYTYSTSDWMLNPAFTDYAKDWAFHSVEELKGKMDDDRWLNAPDSNSIILAHDHEGLFRTVSALVDHLRGRGFEFLPVTA